MSHKHPPAFPPDVAQALQLRSGEVTVHYTHPAPLAGAPEMDRVLMETPYERVLAALVLDTKLTLRFIRTGSREEGARVARVDVSPLVCGGRHWVIGLSWNAERLGLTVRDQDDPEGAALAGGWP